MNKKSCRCKILAALFAFCGLFFSCGGNKIVSSVDREHRFDLEYGNFEDQLNAFDLASSGVYRTSLVMRDGFFYISNSESQKIMEMNSYGDLISLYYNDEKQLKPSFASSDTSVGATRAAIVYPFSQVTSIAVDSRKYLYAVDKLPVERQEFDSIHKQSLNQVVLRFDENKKFVDYIGQQGPGGTPFPFVSKIYTTDRNELVVLCNTPTGNIVYWFSNDGFLNYTIPLEKENVPNPFASEDTDSFFSLGNIVPDYKEHKLYIKVDYFQSYIDESSHVQSGIEFVTTLIHPFNLDTASYEDPVTISPYSEQHSEGFSQETFEVPYDFLGVTESGWMFFMVSTEEGFSIQMVQSDGQKILKRRIPMNREDDIFYSFDLSREGIISALLVQKEKASVNCWRIDSLIQAVIKK